MSPFERTLLHASTWLVALSGSVYFFMKYVMTGGDPYSVIHHPLQPHALSLHVLSAPILVFSLGLIARDHILGYLLESRQRRGRATGILAVSLAAPMIVSGYLMQVLTDPGPRRILSIIHLAGGALYVVLFVGHLVASRNGRRGANGSGAGRPRSRRLARALP